MKTMHVKSYNEAIDRCRRIQRDEGFDVFRGQHRCWSIMPSGLRIPPTEQAIQSQLQDDFLHWAHTAPRMNLLATSDDEIFAIGQHYGIPTLFVDFSKSIDVAGYFASIADQSSTDGTSVIFCGSSKAIIAVSGCRIVAPSIPGLWRLDLQQGLFVRTETVEAAAALEESLVKITFPSVTGFAPLTSLVYPERKSDLETQIDQFLYRAMHREVAKRLEVQGTEVLRIRRHTYPGAVRARSDLPINETWLKIAPVWIKQHPDRLPDLGNVILAPLLLPTAMQTSSSIEWAREAIRSIVSKAQTDKLFIEFDIQSPGSDQQALKELSWALSRFWDGLRPLPFETTDVVEGLAVALVIAVARLQNPSRYLDHMAELFPEPVLIEFCPQAGQLVSGYVSKPSLRRAIYRPLLRELTPYYVKKIGLNSERLLQYVIEPQHVFDAENIISLFVRQMLPTAFAKFVSECWQEKIPVREARWPLSYNPLGLAYTTLATYTNSSPYAMVRDIRETIVFRTDMGREDIANEAIGAIHEYHRRKKPFRFIVNGLEADRRELWQTKWMVSATKILLDIGLPGVLHPFDQWMDDEINGRTRPISNPDPSLGAFFLWALGTGRAGMLTGNLTFGTDQLGIFMADLQTYNKIADETYLRTGGSALMFN
jgi:FRG domain